MRKTHLPCEKFGNFMMTPPHPLHIISANHVLSLNKLVKNNQQYAIDNSILYKELFDIEGELKSLKNIINNLYYHTPTYYHV